MRLSTVLIVTLILAVCLLSVEGKRRKSRKTNELGKLEVETTFKPTKCKQKTKFGDTIKVEYTGKLTDGTVFDSSVGREPFEFKLGSGSVIRGWEEGLRDACPGEKRKLTIPPHLGYGDEGFQEVIPPKATLVFDVELVAITQVGKTAPPPPPVME